LLGSFPRFPREIHQLLFKNQYPHLHVKLQLHPDFVASLFETTETSGKSDDGSSSAEGAVKGGDEGSTKSGGNEGEGEGGSGNSFGKRRDGKDKKNEEKGNEGGYGVRGDEENGGKEGGEEESDKESDDGNEEKEEVGVDKGSSQSGGGSVNRRGGRTLGKRVLREEEDVYYDGDLMENMILALLVREGDSVEDNGFMDEPEESLFADLLGENEDGGDDNDSVDWTDDEKMKEKEVKGKKKSASRKSKKETRKGVLEDGKENENQDMYREDDSESDDNELKEGVLKKKKKNKKSNEKKKKVERRNPVLIIDVVHEMRTKDWGKAVLDAIEKVAGDFYYYDDSKEEELGDEQGKTEGEVEKEKNAEGV
jgi:hypothetical protein